MNARRSPTLRSVALGYVVGAALGAGLTMLSLGPSDPLFVWALALWVPPALGGAAWLALGRAPRPSADPELADISPRTLAAVGGALLGGLTTLCLVGAMLGAMFGSAPH